MALALFPNRPRRLKRRSVPSSWWRDLARGRRSASSARIKLPSSNTRGLAPERICAVTFTNRVAEEIRRPADAHPGGACEAITRGTIPLRMCLALLREHAEAAGLKKGFVVADEQLPEVIWAACNVPLELAGIAPHKPVQPARVQKQDYELTPTTRACIAKYTAWLRTAHGGFRHWSRRPKSCCTLGGTSADAIAAALDYLLVAISGT